MPPTAVAADNIRIPAATGLLLLHTQPIEHLGELAAAGATFGTDTAPMRVQLLVDAVAALVVLVGAAALAVFKPRGAIRRPTGQPGRGRTSDHRAAVVHNRKVRPAVLP